MQWPRSAQSPASRNWPGPSEARPVAIEQSRSLLIFPCNGNGLEALDALDERVDFLGFVDDTAQKQATDCFGYPVFPRKVLADRSEANVLAVPGSPETFRQRRNIIDS